MQYILRRKNQLIAQLKDLIERLDTFSASIKGEKLGDAWLRKSSEEIGVRLAAYVEAMNAKEFLFSGFRSQHPRSGEKHSFYEQAEGRGALSSGILKWRRELNQHPFTSRPVEELKEIFDFYFQSDLYGSFADEETYILSSGAKELPFFSPPAGVRVALDVSNRNNWFGYSDSLGHIESRQAVAALEREQRSCKKIDESNIALVQGGTQGLNTILRFLKEKQVYGKFVCILPTYAPLFEEMEKSFGVEPCYLSHENKLDFNKLVDAVLQDGVGGLMLSIPHNPPLCRQLTTEQLAYLAKVCADNNRYLIIDEVIVGHQASKFYKVEEHSTTIIISSYSKRFAVAGLKLGHVLTNSTLISSLYRFASSSYGSPPSFLYLTSTTICALEHQRLTSLESYHHADVLAEFSNPEKLTFEYSLWNEAEELFENVVALLIDELVAFRSSPSSWSILTAELGSPNRILAATLKGPSYKTFLETLRCKNTSLFPVDCMIPFDERHHLRFTTPIHPRVLMQGLAASIEVIDDLVARQNIGDWIEPEVYELVERVGLLGEFQEFLWVGHIFRVDFRLRQICELLGVELPLSVRRAAHLHDIGKVWTKITQAKQVYYWSKLFRETLPSQLSGIKDDSIWGKWIIEKLNQPPGKYNQYTHEFKLLTALFEIDSYDYEPFWVATLSVADVTSDFIGGSSLSWNDLHVAANLKSQQIARRYGISIEQAHASMERVHARITRLKNDCCEQSSVFSEVSAISR